MQTCAQQALQQADKQLKKRIGILGGTFNPPHIAHLMMADQVGVQLQLDCVFLMPSAEPPHKDGKETIASEHREKMVRLAIEDNPLLAIETYEMQKGGKNYTYNTMRALKEAHPEYEIYFIVGGDMVDDLPTWYRIDELVNEVQLVGVYRAGSRMASPYPIMFVDCPHLDLSSTEIRTRVALEQSIRYQVPEAVRYYILEQGLYRYDGQNKTRTAY